MNKFLFAASLLTVSSFSALGQDSFTSIIGAGYGTSDNNDFYNINGSYFFLRQILREARLERLFSLTDLTL